MFTAPPTIASASLTVTTVYDSPVAVAHKFA
jgi:hypothetical protein